MHFYSRFSDYPTMFTISLHLISDGRCDHLYLYESLRCSDSHQTFVLSNVPMRHYDNKFERLFLIRELIKGGEE